MGNLLEHHHELRIPATETLGDITKILFHGKDQSHSCCDVVHGPETLSDHSCKQHKKSLSKAKRHAHPGPKHGVIESYGIAGNGTANPSEVLIERIRCTFTRELRHLDDDQTNPDGALAGNRAEQSSEDRLEQVYESLIADSEQLVPEQIEPDHLLDTLVAQAQESSYGTGVEM